MPERGDWHESEEESDHDGPDMMNPGIAASTDEEEDGESTEDSGYLSEEESEAESFMANQRQGDNVNDKIMWRELDEAFQLMEQDEIGHEASSGRSSPEEDAPWDQHKAFQLMDPEEVEDERRSGRSSPAEYAPWDQQEIHVAPQAQAWEPARPPTPFRMVDNMLEASESGERAVAEEDAADGEASPPPGEPTQSHTNRAEIDAINVALTDPRWPHMWVCQRVEQMQEAERQQRIEQQQEAERQVLREERARCNWHEPDRQRLAWIVEHQRQRDQQQENEEQQQENEEHQQ
ncbi:probable serine/threonine-protein kinase mps1 [Drosophila willistoni]|uniref:probable serine/threonine-protein kinase mps1 n=1 Tax=Drosophila willistoni TaxID=7260 RepID=UPI00017D8E66|nr:probable serine/threonine-protein kinase mps1 [Drosophila willistoni]